MQCALYASYKLAIMPFLTAGINVIVGLLLVYLHIICML